MQEQALQFLHEKRREAELQLEQSEADLSGYLDRVVHGADQWLTATFKAAVIRYMHQPVTEIVCAHGVEAAVGYLTMHRNGTFDRAIIDVSSKGWKRDALTELIDGLQQILSPPSIAALIEDEPNEQSDGSATADNLGA